MKIFILAATATAVYIADEESPMLKMPENLLQGNGTATFREAECTEKT